MVSMFHRSERTETSLSPSHLNVNVLMGLLPEGCRSMLEEPFLSGLLGSGVSLKPPKTCGLLNKPSPWMSCGERENCGR